MPLQALCAAPTVPAAAPVPALATTLLCGIGGVSARCSRTGSEKDWAAARGEGRSVTVSVGGGRLWLRRAWGAPTSSRDAVTSAGVGARTQDRADLFSAQGLRSAYRKRWVVQLSNSDQGQEILDEKKTQSSEENNGPPVLTIIAGLIVLVVAFWALGSLASWILGLLFK